MKLPYPDTIAGRTLLVLVVGLALSHAFSMVFYVTDRQYTVGLRGGEHVAERVVTVMKILEGAPREKRRELVRLASTPGLHVRWLEEAPSFAEQEDGRKTTALRRAFSEKFPIDRPFEFRYTERSPTESDDPADAEVDGARHESHIDVSLQLSDGTWLSFLAPAGDPDSIWSMRFVLSMAVMIGSVILLTAFVVYQMNRPLQLFAAAAHKLGIDVHAPPLDESGPREVRETARAFNEMHHRIRHLVDDRTEMLAAISHDLRTPITTLRLRAEFIDEGEHRSKILSTLDEMESMVQSLLAFARDNINAEDMRTVDLSALLSSVCDDLNDAGFPVEFEESDRLPHRCRPSALKRAVTNVINNAVKYAGRAFVRLYRTNGEIVIVVEDDGPGIPDAQMDRVFSPFHRLEGSRSSETGGSGLGLTIARAAVVAHGGSIKLENRLQGGLRARITLPIVCD